MDQQTRKLSRVKQYFSPLVRAGNLTEGSRPWTGHIKKNSIKLILSKKDTYVSPPLFNKYLVRKFQEPGNEASDQSTDLATKRGSRVAGMEDPFWIRQGSDTEESCDRLSVRWREEGRIHAERTGSHGPDVKGLSL